MSNPLTDVLPAKVRRYVYAVVSLAAAIFTVYQATEGDWKEFTAGALAVLVGATATSNTDTQPQVGP